MLGITSAASRTAQSGPLEIVTSDAEGNLATDGGAFQNSLNSAFTQIGDVREGVAIATAMDTPDLVAGESFGIKFNFAEFEGESAVAFSAAGVLTNNVFGNGGRLTLDAGLGYGTSRGTTAARGGLQLTW